MDIGVIFPQTEVGGDRGAVRAIGQAVAELGYTHLAAYDHVLGGDTAVHGDLGGPYTIDDTFREPLTMFAYLAGCTDLGLRHLHPDRAAAPDGAAGQAGRRGRPAVRRAFPARARHRLEQGRVRRARHALRAAGRHLGGAGRRAARAVDAAERHRRRPLPPHPGGRAGPAAGAAPDPDLDRRLRPGRACAGWGGSPTAGSPRSARAVASNEALEIIREGAAEAGRDLSGFQFEGRLEYATRDHDKMAEHARRWREAGASHLSVNTMHAGLRASMPTSMRWRRWQRSCCSADRRTGGMPT